eukprot:964964-Rhodomonas_salina.4
MCLISLCLPPRQYCRCDVYLLISDSPATADRGKFLLPESTTRCVSTGHRVAGAWADRNSNLDDGEHLESDQTQPGRTIR